MNTSIPAVALNPNQQTTPTMSPEEAFEFVKPEVLARTDAQNIHINIEIPGAIATALGALPAIMALRARVIDELPRFDVSCFDTLQIRAMATLHAHVVYLGALTPPGLAELNEQAIKRRAVLLSEAKTLVLRGKLDATRISDFRSSVGHKGLATELVGLATLLKQIGATDTLKTGVDQAELTEAIELGTRMITAIGSRDHAPAVIAEVSQVRTRCFSLFVDTYDSVRQAVCFLRWKQGDADTIAPSLYAGRSRRKGEATDQERNGDAGSPGVAPAVASPSLVSPAVASPAAASAASATPAPTSPVTAPNAASSLPMGPLVPSLPGAAPFLR